MQPWRFIRVRDRSLRERIRAPGGSRAAGDVARAWASARTSSCASRSKEFSSAASCSWSRWRRAASSTCSDAARMPEMDLASVACAIQNLWLAARAEGIGMGWVSLFEPETLRELLRMPEGSRPVAVLCLGHVPRVLPAADARDGGVGSPLQPCDARAYRLLVGRRCRLTARAFCVNLSIHDKFPSRGLKGNSG